MQMLIRAAQLIEKIWLLWSTNEQKRRLRHSVLSKYSIYNMFYCIDNHWIRPLWPITNSKPRAS